MGAARPNAKHVAKKCMSAVPGIYRHYKGQRYRVLGTARHSETLEELVVYQALYGEFGLWVRPATMFAGTVELDGRVVPRFALEEAVTGPLETL